MVALVGWREKGEKIKVLQGWNPALQVISESLQYTYLYTDIFFGSENEKDQDAQSQGALWGHQLVREE